MAKKLKKIKRSNGFKKKKRIAPTHISISSRQNMLQQAVALHQAGRRHEAEALYRKILQADPDHPGALNYLGLLSYQVGQGEAAVDLIKRAVASRPDNVEAHINLGTILKSQGKFEEAIDSFRRALSYKPDLALLHYNLGVTLYDMGKLEDAVASYRQALALKPDIVEAHINLAIALQAMGRFDEAIASYRQVLTLKPDIVEAHSNLGVIFKEQGRLDEAVDSYRRALALKPDLAALHYNLGIIMNDMGKHEDAIASYRQALALKSDFAEVHSNLGYIYSELGRMDDAISCFKKALSLKPDDVQAFKGLSTLVKYKASDEVIHKMEEIFNQERELSDADRIVLGFALGKIFEDIGDYGKSFDFIFKANSLKRKSYEYSIQDVCDLFERIKKAFSADFFLSHQGAGNEDSNAIFILGMPRSGTTLVEQILASHPQVGGAGESHVLEKLVNGNCPEGTSTKFPECVLAFSKDVFYGIGSDYIKEIRKYSGDSKYVTDKLLSNFLRVGLIKTILPNAKVIHCQRNPMDNCWSIFKNDFTTIHGYAYDMVELGRYYTFYLDLMGHWEKILPGFMHSIWYEELVTDQQEQTKRLLDFCGLPWDEACLDFHKTERRVRTASYAQVRQPLYTDSVELWRRYEKQLEPLKKAINGKNDYY